MSKLSKLTKDLRRSSRLTVRQALMLKGGDDKRMGNKAPSSGITGPSGGNVAFPNAQDLLGG